LSPPAKRKAPLKRIKTKITDTVAEKKTAKTQLEKLDPLFTIFSQIFVKSTMYNKRPI
jgi:hypothetical protein